MSELTQRKTNHGEGMMGALKVIDIPEERPVLSLELPAQTSFDEWVAIGRRLCLGSQAINWHIGDWWAFGDHRYGERAKVAAEGLFGREFGSLANLATVSRKFETSRRREHLSFTCHAEVAGLPPSQADALLTRAEHEGWSTRDLRSHVSGNRKEAREASPLNQFPVQERLPSIAQAIEEEAARLGEKLPDFLARLISIGWEQYLAQRGEVARV